MFSVKHVDVVVDLWRTYWYLSQHHVRNASVVTTHMSFQKLRSEVGEWRQPGQNGLQRGPATRTLTTSVFMTRWHHCSSSVFVSLSVILYLFICGQLAHNNLCLLQLQSNRTIIQYQHLPRRSGNNSRHAGSTVYRRVKYG